MQLPLMDGRALVIVQELNGILNGDDVVVLLAIDAIEKHGQGRGLAGASGAGDEDNSISELGDLRQLFGQAQGGKVGNCGRNHPHDDGTTATLNKDIDAKTGQARQSVGDVASAMLPERSNSLLVVTNQVGGNMPGIIGSEEGKPGNLHRNHLAVDLNLGWTAGREDQITDFFCSAQHGAEQSGRGNSATSRETF